MTRFALGPRPPDPRIAPARVCDDADPDGWDLVTRVMALWDAKQDTATIALDLFQPEATITAALRIGRERRRNYSRG